LLLGVQYFFHRGPVNVTTAENDTDATIGFNGTAQQRREAKDTRWFDYQFQAVK
jgi:hypothetical protein